MGGLLRHLLRLIGDALQLLPGLLRHLLRLVGDALQLLLGLLRHLRRLILDLRDFAGGLLDRLLHAGAHRVDAGIQHLLPLIRRVVNICCPCPTAPLIWFRI